MLALQVLDEQGDYSGAEKALQTAISATPDEPMLYNNLGLVMNAQGNHGGQALLLLYECPLFSTAAHATGAASHTSAAAASASATSASASAAATSHTSNLYCCLCLYCYLYHSTSTCTTQDRHDINMLT